MSKYLHPKIAFILFLFFLQNPYHSNAQSNCPNADFSFGDFTNWVGYTGTFTSCCPTVGIVPGRHTIINTPGTDPRTGNMLSLLPPGATVCAKLGNEDVNAEAERLRYTMTVDPQSALFIYKYAVVMEDPGHAPSDQPKFDISVLNSNGSLVDPVCGFYSVVSSGSIPGFQSAGGSVMWKDWTSVGIDLTAYMGQNITIQYTTYDCAQGAHYGYAYLTASCAPMQINVGFCQGNSTVTISAPLGFASYQWTPGGQTTQSVTITNPVIGTPYSCLMTSVNGCQVTLNAILQPTIITPHFNITSALCSFNVIFQDSSTVNQGSLNTWLWDFGDGITSTVQNPSHTYTSPGAYTVTLTVGSLGCTATTTQNVSVFPSTVANAGANQTICQGQTANLSVTGGISYLWSNNDTTSFSNVSPSVTTTYTVTVTDNNGCTASDDVVVNVNLLPAAEAGPDAAFCAGSSTNLNASGGTTYSWSPTTGLSNPNIANPVANPTTSTPYTVTVTNGNGCSNIDIVNITVNPLPTAEAGPPQSICNTNSATLNASGGTIYHWSTLESTQSITVSPNTTSTYTVTVTDGNGCSQTDNVIITVYNLPIANAGNNTSICNGLSTNLNASGGQSYSWSPASGLSNTAIPNPVATPTSSTTYTVTVTDVNGCSATDDVAIGIFPSPSVSFSANLNNGCEPLTVNFTDNTTPAIQSWQWNFGDPSSSSNTSTVQNPSHIFVSPGTYNVTLAVTTSDGCQGTYTHSNMITVYPNPTASFTPQPLFCTTDYPINFIDGSSNAYSWSWNFGDGATSIEQNPSHPYSQIGYHTVWLVVETNKGCIDSTSKEILIFNIKIPNVFTPNGDGSNDYFVITGIEYVPNCQLMIFNRWGKKIYESSDYKNDWDGGNSADGVYYYIFNLPEGKITSYHGTVTILR